MKSNDEQPAENEPNPLPPRYWTTEQRREAFLKAKAKLLERDADPSN